jgi:hypothetical protein
MKDCIDNQVQSVLSIPYFEGDFWATIIEESIKGMYSGIRYIWKIVLCVCIELGREEEDRRMKEAVEAACAMEDDGSDDSIEPEDSTDVKRVRKLTCFVF